MKRPVICLTEISGGHYVKNAREAIYEEIKEYSKITEIREFTDTRYTV